MSRLLVDENLPPALAAMLRQAGHDAVHVNQVGLAGTEDPTIMATSSVGRSDWAFGGFRSSTLPVGISRCRIVKRVSG